jgi:hypothetical protein
MEIGRQFSFEILIPCPERRNVRARIEGLMMVSGAEKSRVALTAASKPFVIGPAAPACSSTTISNLAEATQ